MLPSGSMGSGAKIVMSDKHIEEARYNKKARIKKSAFKFTFRVTKL